MAKKSKSNYSVWNQDLTFKNLRQIAINFLTSRAVYLLLAFMVYCGGYFIWGGVTNYGKANELSMHYSITTGIVTNKHLKSETVFQIGSGGPGSAAEVTDFSFDLNGKTYNREQRLTNNVQANVGNKVSVVYDDQNPDISYIKNAQPGKSAAIISIVVGSSIAALGLLLIYLAYFRFKIR